MISTILKTAWRVLERPEFAQNLAGIEIDKLWRRLSPPRDGLADRIRQCSIRVTDLCNLRCHTCGQWGDNGYLRSTPPRELKAREVPTERYLELLRDLAAHGHRPSVYLWGGEPMLHPGAVEILEEAGRLGMAPSIATNGTGIAEHAARLVQAPLFLLQVSVDGPDATVHNACRPGAGPGGDNHATAQRAIRAVGAMRAARGRRLPLIASLTTINERNQDRLVATYESLADHVDLCVFYLSWWIDEPAAARHTEDFARRFGAAPTTHRGWIGGWRPTDARTLSQQLLTLSQLGRDPRRPGVVILPHLTEVAQLERYYTDHGARFGFDRCVSIYGAVEIDSNGDMSPCRDYHDYVVGNVREHTISELWNAEPYRRFRQSLSSDGLMPVCTRCCGLMGY